MIGFARTWRSVGLLLPLVLLGVPRSAMASKVGWMDEVVQRILRNSDEELGRAGTRSSVRLFDEASETGLSTLARRSDTIAHAARPVDDATDAALELRFARLMRSDPEAMRTFRALEPTEKRLVLRMGEAAQRLARRYPDRADEMIGKLGIEGLTAVRVYGDDVAEVIAREGPDSINVLRKTGRAGWSFYTGTVLKHKKKLLAAGVLGLFLANPERFIDSAGRVTEYAVSKFSEAGIDLAGAIGSGAARGLEQSLSQRLAAFGLSGVVLKWMAMIAAGTVALISMLVLLGLPTSWFFRFVGWPLRLVGRGLRATVRSS